MSDYFKTRKIETLARLNEVLSELPDFATDFFIGIEPQTSELTRLNYAYDLRIFFYYLTTLRAFKGREIYDFKLSDLEAVTLSDLERYINWLTSYKYKGKLYSNEERGKARKLSSVRTFYRYFYRRGMIETNVASKVSMPKLHEKEIIRLEVNEVTSILDTADTGAGLKSRQASFHKKTKQRDLAILTLLLGTGIRVSELVGLNISDIDFNSRAFTVTRKGGNKTILYFGAEVEEALGEYIYGERKEMKDIIDKDALFLSLQKRRISVRAVENLVKKYAKIIAPLKKISPHKLRSTFGTNLYRATRDIYMVADVLGHRDVNTTKKHYAAISDDHRRLAAKTIVLRNDENKE